MQKLENCHNCNSKLACVTLEVGKFCEDCLIKFACAYLVNQRKLQTLKYTEQDMISFAIYSRKIQGNLDWCKTLDKFIKGE
jgi:hypothetical protein